MLDLDPQIILTQAAAFILLILLFKKFLFGPIGGMLQARQDEVKETLDQIATDRQAMEDTRADYESRLANIEAEARDRIADAVREAQEEAGLVMQKAREDADTARNRASADIDQERRIALAQIRSEAADLIVTATTRVLREAVDEATQRRLITQFVDEVSPDSPDAGHA